MKLLVPEIKAEIGFYIFLETVSQHSCQVFANSVGLKLQPNLMNVTFSIVVVYETKMHLEYIWSVV